MRSDTSTLSELRYEIYLSMKRLEKSETPKSNGNSRLIQEVRNLKTAVVEIDRFLLAIYSNLDRQGLLLNQGTCNQHERLGQVTWERGQVPCPVCERNRFIESQSKDVAQRLGFEHFPIWDAYFCLRDLPPLERKKRVEEIGERIREISERKSKTHNEAK